jgi:sterol desaturase/sphingolipid hydroxylase (fatty acid hydroxylase superfamily)
MLVRSQDCLRFAYVSSKVGRRCRYVIAVVGSQHHHCGYSWPRGRNLCGGGLFSVLTPAPQPHFHDFHHERGGGAPGAGNYGLLGVLDWLHGTDRPWREHCHALSAAAAAAKRA